jgi:hypothetical protein
MDDLLILHQDRDSLEPYTLQIAVYLQYLGWTLSLDKCEFTPKQEITFLGWLWDFKSLSLKMTPEAQTSMKNLVQWTKKKAIGGSTMLCKKLGSVIGSLNFLREQIPRASLYLRGLHSALTAAVNAQGWSKSATLPRAIVSELLWWKRNIGLNTPYCFIPRPSQGILITDASELGWGAILHLGDRSYIIVGFFSMTDSSFSRNLRETTSVLRAILVFRHLLRHEGVKALTIRSDNSATVCNLQRQGAGPNLLPATRKIFSIQQKLDIDGSGHAHPFYPKLVMHIPGVDNGDVDRLSRMEVTGDYALREETFRQALTMLGIRPTIDLFAHCMNNRLPRFAAIPGPLAVGATALDAFTMDWTAEIPYIFPPVQLIPRVLQKLQTERVTAVVVVPRWPSQAWWNLLLLMARKIVELGPSDQVLIPGPGMTGCHVTIKLPPGYFWMVTVSLTELTPPMHPMEVAYED